MTLTTPARAGAQPGPEPSPPGGRASDGTPRVVAVLVAHDGERWLPRALEALAAQTRPPDVVVAVDTGSTDGSLALLRAALGDDQVLQAPRRSGFGAAVSLGLAHAPSVEHRQDWVWLLHDDCAPRPDALQHLLAAGTRSSRVGVVGPKLVDWDDPIRLLEVGLTVGRGGRRDTGLDGAERDQGQHDHRTDVLAVGSAGLLAERSLWDRLDGFDPALPLLRDDIDLCWRAQLAGRRVVLAPRAVVADAQASTRRLRSADALGTSVRRADRRHALHVALARCSLPAVPLVLARLLLLSLVRAVVLLAAKAPGHALDELLAAGAVLLLPWRWIGSRRRARTTRTVRRSSLDGLLSPRFAVLRRGAEASASWFTRFGRGHAPAPAAAPVETGPTADEASSQVLPPLRWPLRVARHPLAATVLLTLAVTAAAARRLLADGRSGPSMLTGGELGRVSGTGADLWRAAVDPLRGSGLGIDEQASPAAAVQALIVRGLEAVAGAAAPTRAVDLLLLGAPALAAVSAYLASGVATRSRWARAWLAAAWGLSPLLTSAVSHGRLGPVAVHLLLPLVAAGAARALAPRREGSLTAAFACALGLALVGSVQPVLLVIGAVVALAGVAASRGSGRVRALVLLLVPPALLGPWLLELVRRPALLLAGPGAVHEGGPTADPGPDRLLDLLATVVDLPGGVPRWAGAGLLAPVLLVGLLALLRSGRRGHVATALWGLALLSLAGALLAPRVVLQTDGDLVLRAWAGPWVTVLVLCALGATAVSVDGLQGRLARHRFGWRQLLLAPVLVLAVLAPLAASASWVWRGADDPLRTAPQTPLPAVAVDAARGPAGVRTLVLSQAATGVRPGSLVYRLDGAEPAPWTRDLPLGDDPGVVAATVSALTAPGVAGGDGRALDGLQALAVGFVLVDTPVPAAVEQRLDSTGGLVRIGAPRSGQLWRVGTAASPLTARVRVVDARGEVAAQLPVTGGRTRVDTTVAAGPQGRRLVLAELSSPEWRASLDGRPLTAVRLPGGDAWRQAFELPAASGRLVVERVDAGARAWQWGQLGLLALVALLALPVRRPVQETW